MKIIFATRNSGKMKEIRELMKDLDIELLNSEEAGVVGEAVEDGTTFEENALRKAEYVSKQVKEWVIAEDGGICIKALNNAPGVFSARWAGEGANEVKIVAHTLQELINVPDNKRDAWFECDWVVLSPTGKTWKFRGVADGKITKIPTGIPRANLPYDVIFAPVGGSLTYAELSDEQKNSLSHRRRAYEKFKEFFINNQNLFKNI